VICQRKRRLVKSSREKEFRGHDYFFFFRAGAKDLEAPIHLRGGRAAFGRPHRIDAASAAPIPASVSAAATRNGAEIEAVWRNITESSLCTTIAAKGVSVATIEHLMAAFAGLEVDNAGRRSWMGRKVPAMDGSAAALRVPDRMRRARRAEMLASSRHQRS